MTEIRTVRRRRLAYPPSDVLKGLAVDTVPIDAALLSLRAPTAELLRDIANGAHPELLHRLSDHFATITNEPVKTGRDIDGERLWRHFVECDPLGHDNSCLIDALRAANALLQGQTGGLRDREAWLSMNCANVRVFFPDAAGTEQALLDLDRNLKSVTLTLGSAIVALALILNSHPFFDGNGRVARAFYAYLLTRLGAPTYFPLQRFFAPTAGSFELNLRELEIRDDWTPFFRFNCRLLGLSLGRS